MGAQRRNSAQVAGLIDLLLVLALAANLAVIFL